MKRFSLFAPIALFAVVSTAQPALAQDQTDDQGQEGSGAVEDDAGSMDAGSDVPDTPMPTTGRRSDSFLFSAPSQSMVFGSTGYSGGLRAGYMAPLGDGFSLGGEFILDLGLFNSVGSGLPGTVTIGAGAPIKLAIAETNKVVVGLTFTPGIGATIFDLVVTTETLFALLLHVSSNVGYMVNDQLTVGGGIDIPFSVFLGSANFVIIPLLFGPAAEYKVDDNLSLTAELKLGPHIAAGDASTTTFGFKTAVGATFRF